MNIIIYIYLFRVAAAPEPTALESGILSAFQRMPLPSAASIDERYSRHLSRAWLRTQEPLA